MFQCQHSPGICPFLFTLTLNTLITGPYSYHIYLMLVAPMYIYNLNLSWELKKCLCKCLTHHLHLDFRSTCSKWPAWVLSCSVQFCDPMDCSPPSSSVHGIFQARMLVRVAISYSRGSSWPRDWTCISCIDRGILPLCYLRSLWWVYVCSSLCLKIMIAISQSWFMFCICYLRQEPRYSSPWTGQKPGGHSCYPSLPYHARILIAK